MDKKKIYKYLLAAFVIAFIVGIYIFTPINQYLKPEKLIELTKEVPKTWETVFAILGIYAIAGIAFIPIPLVAFATSLIFNIWQSILISLAGFAIAGFCGYLLGRVLGRDFFGKTVKKHIEKVEKKVNKKGPYAVFALRFAPTPPFTITSIISGIIKITPLKYLIASTLGICPLALSAIFFGKGALEVMKDPSAIAVTSFIAAIILFIVYKTVKGQINFDFKSIKKVLTQISQDKITQSAAALSFYGIFSLGPIVVILFNIFNLLGYDSKARILSTTEEMFGERAQSIFQGIVESDIVSVGFSSVTGWVAGFLLLYSASTILRVLKSTLSSIFEVENTASSMSVIGVLQYFKERIVSLAIIIFLILTSVLSIFSTALLDYINQLTALYTLLSIVINILIYSMLFTLIFKLTTRKNLAWIQSFKGGLLTAVLFYIGKDIIAFSLHRINSVSVFGAAGSLAIVLIWLYYSSIILFLGASVTKNVFTDQLVKD